MAKYTPRIDHSKKDMVHDDIVEDKKIVKKAFRLHDEQEHPGEKTDLSKLKRGGRAKKATGSVRNFKAGGLIAAKEVKAKPKAGLPSLAGKPDMFKKGGKC